MKMQSSLAIPLDHPAFAGHFPALPVLPGAILLDEMLHAIELARGIDLTRWQIGAAKFLDTVQPGDSLILEHDAPAPGLIRFTIHAGSRKVSSGTLHEA
jgi:3-hydroxyacyl-[acyl-carrier-protein] dehydratase